MKFFEILHRCICENYTPTFDIGPVLFVAAHPDDETISASGLLQRLKKAHFVYITDGAPRNLSDAERANYTSRESYAHARRHELQEALAWAGLESICQIHCNITDQETPYNMAGIACRLANVIENIKPVCIFTHAYEGGHPDHDTASFVVWAACKMLKRKSKTPLPYIYEFSSYHGVGNGPEIVTYDFIHSKGNVVLTSNLTETECDIKKKMISCFKSQASTVALFSIGVERFRNSPNYNYRLRPHDGPLYYEFFDWGITSEKWRRLAVEAILLLKIGR
jgi:LmbE family N-acetylglucosaminyl deacetylase